MIFWGIQAFGLKETNFRGWIATCPTYDGAAIEAVPLAEAAGLPASDEHGLAEVFA